MNLSVESSPNIYKTSTATSTPTTTKEMTSNASPKIRLTTTSSTSTIIPNVSTSNRIESQKKFEEPGVHYMVPKGSTGSYTRDNFSSSSSCSSSTDSFSPSNNNNNNDNNNNTQSANSNNAAYTQQLYDDDNDDRENDYNHITNTQDPASIIQSPNNNNKNTNQEVFEEMVDSNCRILPENFKDCARDDLLILISRMLTHIISLNDEIDVKISSKELTRFHSRAPPNISIHSYLSRLAHYSSLDNAILIVAVYYIDLLSSTYPIFSINSLTIHRFLLTATTVGAKGLCDSFCSNNHYAKVGGVHVSELNVLEAEFLTNVNWRIVPRDFTSNDSIQRRNSSTGTLNDDGFQKKYKSGVAAAEEVLDLYYNRMVALFGSNTKEWSSDVPESGIKYVLERKNIDDDVRFGKVKAQNFVDGGHDYSPLKRSADHIGIPLTRGKRRNDCTQ